MSFSLMAMGNHWRILVYLKKNFFKLKYNE